MTVESETIGTQTAEETGSTLIGQADASIKENEQLAEAGEFDQLAEKVNSDLTKIDMQGDERSVKTIECLRVIANDGLPEHRVWASGMLNYHNKMLIWQNEMAKFMKGL